MAIGRAFWRIGLPTLLLILTLGILLVHGIDSAVFRRLMVRNLERATGVSLGIGALDVSLLPPSLTAREVRMSKGAERFLSARLIAVDLSIWRSLWEGAWVADVSVEAPELITGDRSEVWHPLETAIRSLTSEPAAEPTFVLRTLTIRSGRLDLDLSQVPLHVEVTGLSVEVTARGLLDHRIAFDSTGRVMVEREAKRLEITRLAVHGRTSATGISVEAGVIDGQPGSLRWSGELDGDRLRGRLDWTAALDPLFALIPEAGAVGGVGRIRATVEGTTTRPEIGADFEARAVRVGGIAFSGSGRFKSTGREWALESTRAEIFGGDVAASASGRLMVPVPFEARASFTRLNAQSVLDAFDARTSLRAAWSGEVRVAGHLLGDADYHGDSRFALEQAGNKLDGVASFSIAKSIADMEGTVKAGAADRLSVRCRIAEHGEMSGEINGKAERLGMFGAFVGLDLQGAGEGRVQLLGTLDEPLLRGEVSLARLAARGISFGAVRAPFEISAEGLKSAKIEVADGQIQISGRIALTQTQHNEWSAFLRNASLDQVTPALRLVWPAVPDLDGRIDGTVRASGPWTGLLFDAGLQLAEVVVGGEQLGQGSVDARRSDGRWRARADFRRPDGAASTLRMELEANGGLSIDAEASGWRLERLEAVHSRVPELVGDVGLQGSVVGSVSQPRGDLSLAFSDVELAHRPIGKGTLRAHMTGARATIEGALGAIRVSAETDLAAPYPFHARAECSRLDVGPFVAATSGVTIRLDGTAELRGDTRQPLEQGSVRIAAITIERGAQKFENPLPIVIHIDKGAVDLPDAEVKGAGQRVVVGGRWAPEEAEIHSSASGDLALLEALTTTVASARGRLEADVRASRHGKEPWQFRGRARLTGAALDLAFLVGITDLSGELDLEDRKLELRNLTGKLGGGKILVAGTLGLDSGWDLGWAIHDASLGVPSWLDYRASGNGRFLGPIRAPELSGEIEIEQAVYDRRIDWTEFLPWFRKQANPVRTRATLPIGLDLTLLADGGLFVDNNLAKAEMRSDIRVQGGRGRPLTWRGSIEVLSGEFVFRRRRFSITSGNVRFHDDRPTNPDLEFSGETRIDTRDADYLVQVRVSGTADAPRIQFTADDPALTETDVLALVTFGRTVAQLQSQGAGIDLNEVLALTSGPRAEKLEQGIHAFLPVDRIEVEPSFSRVSGTSEPTLRIGKDLSERLSAVVGTGLGNERHQDFGLEYRVTRRLSLQGAWESQTTSQEGAFGGNLTFRVPFRTLPRFSLLPRCPLTDSGEP
jgi:hypothetical protein